MFCKFSAQVPLERSMVIVEHRDRIAEFSHRLAQIKFIILEIVIFIGFLLWVGDKLIDEFKMHFSATPAHAAEVQKPCQAKLPVFRSD